MSDPEPRNTLLCKIQNNLFNLSPREGERGSVKTGPDRDGADLLEDIHKTGCSGDRDGVVSGTLSGCKVYVEH